MKISVILCTYNRCQSLATALESVASSEIPDSVDWEVLVVDNNSPDQTRDVVQEFCDRAPQRFRYLFEPQQGKSYALNTGIREARGEILAFMDDDVIVEPSWLKNLTVKLASGEAVGVGGRILPRWTSPPPDWLPQGEWFGMAPLVMLDFGLEPRPMPGPPFGTNMAFHRKMFEKYGTFRTDLGPRPGSEIRSEDTEFALRLMNAGESLWYEPTAVVHHAVPYNRLKRDFFLKWWFDKGRGSVYEAGRPEQAKWSVDGVPIVLLRRVVFGTIRWMVAFNPAKRFSRKLAVWLLAGKIVESYRRSSSTGNSQETLACR